MDRRTRITYLLLFTTLTGICLHLNTETPFATYTRSLLLICTGLLIGAAIAIREPRVQNIMDALVSALSQLFSISPQQTAFLLSGLVASAAAHAAAGDGPLVHSALAAPLWLAGMALTAAGLWKPDEKSAPRWPLWEILLAVGLFVLAFGLRAYRITAMPYVLSGDEGSAGLTGLEFINGVRNNPLNTAWFSFPSLYFTLLSLSQRIFGFNEFAIRIVSALAGALCIPALYASVRRAVSRPFALLAALWLAAFHQHVFFSRLAYNNIFDPLFLILALWGMWEGLMRSSRRGWLLLGFALGASQYFYTTSRITLLAGLGALFLIFLFRRERRPNKAEFLAMTATFLSAALPLLFHYIAYPQQLTFTAGRVSLLIPGWTGPAAAALGTTSFGLILEQVWITILGLTTAELQGVYFQPGVPLLFGLSLPLFLAGALLAMLRFRDERLWAPGLVFAGTLLAGGLSIQAPNAQRLLLLPPLLALLCALPLEIGVRWVRRHLPSVAFAASTTSVVLILAAGWQNMDQLFRDYFPRERYGSLNGEVAYDIVQFMHDEPAPEELYFIGGERMNFAAIPSISYLRPDLVGIDLFPPYHLPPDSDPSISRAVIILPAEEAIRDQITRSGDASSTEIRYNRDGDILYFYLRLARNE